jgi:protein O-GlcNAc transferase
MAQLTIQQAFERATQFQLAGRISEAKQLYEQILAVFPRHAEALNNLGLILRDTGRLDESVAAYQRAIAINPGYADAYYNLGGALFTRGSIDAAIDANQKSIALDPTSPESHNNLGNALSHKGELDAAEAAYRRAIALRANYAEAFNNLGNALKDRAEFDAAISAYRQAATLEPDLVEADSNRLFMLQYHPALTAADILKEHELWGSRFAAPSRDRSNSRDPFRPLRIGIVSSTFRRHCQSLFTLPLLRNLNRGEFEVYCYANHLQDDSITTQLRGHAAAWRKVHGAPAAAAAEQIRADQIDILVDLNLHMADSFLSVFAVKPAPVQITWLGYPGTTGLKAIDYRLTDPWLDPEEWTERRYTERSLRLPHTFWCIDPTVLNSRSHEVNQLPVITAGHITFGSLNNFCKVNEPLLALWSRVLDAVPGSRMLLRAPLGSARTWVSEKLQNRVDFFDRSSRDDYLDAYKKIDIGLDTFPYNGHTTSLDSFWMGVPVVTLIGNTLVGRAGYSQLSNLGLPELAGTNEEQFVQIARSLANDLTRLATLRGSLRGRMECSPLMDAGTFARDMEGIFRQVWKGWCEKG